MKQISSFMSEIGDEFKIVVIKAIRELCSKYPKKHRIMVGFLATFLREEGGFEFKKCIVDSIVDLMGAISDIKESSLLHLCEFIEDCEFAELIVQILHIIGSVGPSTSSPSRYIRFIFNRVILENAAVRAAAVSTLGHFAVRVPELRPSIVMLLNRSLADEDDEVRDRAVILLKSLGIADGETKEEEIKFLVDEPFPMTFGQLERSLKAYMAHPSFEDTAENPSAKITLATLPIVEETHQPQVTISKGTKKASTSRKESETASNTEDAVQVDPAAEVYKIPQFAALGRAFRTTKTAQLTENEMEYVVSYVKHIFANHVVIQFDILNTVDDQQLREVTVNVDCSDDECSYEVETVVAANVCAYGERSSCFVCLNRIADPGSFALPCELHFKVVQVDPSTGDIEGSEAGFDEEYPLEAVELSTNDFMAKVMIGDFRRSWDTVGAENEVLEKFALQFKKLEDAVAAVVEFLGMQPVDQTDIVPPSDGTNKAHILHLSGKFIGNINVLVRAQLQPDGSGGVVLKMAVRSGDADVSRLVAECIQ